MKFPILRSIPHFFPAIPSRFTTSLFDSSFVTGSSKKTFSASIDVLLQEFQQCEKSLQSLHVSQKQAQRRLEMVGVWKDYAARKEQDDVDYALVVLGGMLRSCAENDREQMLQTGSLPQSIVARSAWFWFERNVGHRAESGEGDIAVPRFADDRKATFHAALSRPAVTSFDDEFGVTAMPKSLKNRIFSPLMMHHIQITKQHEELLSQALRRVHALRKDLCDLAEHCVRLGKLQRSEQLWEMSIDEVLRDL